MDEVWVRAGLVIGGLLVAGIAALIMRRDPIGRGRRTKVTGLATGVYFFSAESCATCGTARMKLDERIGTDGYTEFVWEREPDLFDEVGIDAVPATLIVSGRLGRIYPGQPDGAFESL
ncbi:MAG TPA: hypothetical protein VGB33_04265 [Acidimicrobiia bacterium]|jgi:hypothetical protein